MLARSSRPGLRTTFRPQVVIPSLCVIGALLILCAKQPHEAEAFFSSGQRWVTGHLDWFYVLAVTIFLGFLVLIGASRFGDIKLGPDDAKPEFSFVSWTAMLFAAGMGIGLMYFGVGEPIQHFVNPQQAASATQQAAREAMLVTFFHWGLHAWAIYGVMGLVLAYFGFRYNLPLTLRSGLYPVLGERMNGWAGHAVDAFALIGTVAGIVTTLGYGVFQLGEGIHRVAGINTASDSFRIWLIAIVVALAGVSAATGLGRGVRRLSELNLLLAFVLLAFVIVAGPTTFLARALGDNIGNYLSSLIEMSLRTYAYEGAPEQHWFGEWTLLYWAWWISWSPFVGMFIARISRGRTIRQFVVGVLIVPTTFNLIWMTAFGNTAIWLDTHQAAGMLARSATNVDALLFDFFDYLPFTQLLSIVSIVLITVFFVTSADSGAFVIDSIATGSSPRSPTWQRLFWAVLLGVTTCVLMLTGGLKALQALTLIAALPVAAIMLALCYGLWHGLKADAMHSSREISPATSFWSGRHWRQRLTQILHHDSEADAKAFIAQTVVPALHAVADELKSAGVVASVHWDADTGIARLVLPDPDLRDFVYGVKPEHEILPVFVPRDAADSGEGDRTVFKPVTFFHDGRPGYVVRYLRHDEVIADVLRQYERYLALSADDRARLLTRAPGHSKVIGD
jgi:choline/glycine/proline betaine transport protein